MGKEEVQYQCNMKTIIAILLCFNIYSQQVLIVNSKRYEIISKGLLYTDTIYECKNETYIRISQTKIFIYTPKNYEKINNVFTRYKKNVIVATDRLPALFYQKIL